MITFPQVARMKGTSRDEGMRRFFTFSVVLIGLVVLALELAVGWLVPLFFGSEFEDAVLITRILLIGTLFWGARRVLTDAASGSGRPGLGSMAELVSWLAVIPALAVLMPIWGVEGAAAAMTISSAASLLALAFLMRYSERRNRGVHVHTGPTRLAEPVD
jgi:O-antigen/teichoic acid export membrane protein